MIIHTAIVDDNSFLIKSVKEKLALFPGVVISFTAHDGIQCMEQLQANKRTDLILMDIEMPRQNGIVTIAQVKRTYPQIKIIVWTVFDDDESIFQAIQAGADGYLLKETTARELHEAMLQTLEGGAVMTPSIAMKTLRFLRNPDAIPQDQEEIVTLTPREIDVLEQLSSGLPYTAIAENLHISPSTVRRHIENIYSKLQVHSKLEAVALAKKRNLI